MPKRGDTKPFVVKIQRALSHPGGPALVYDRARSFTFQVPWAEVKRFFDKDDLKVFALARFKPDRTLSFLEGTVDDPGW